MKAKGFAAAVLLLLGSWCCLRPPGWALKRSPTVARLIGDLQRKDTRWNEREVALWDRLPASVQGRFDLLRPRSAREMRADACTGLASLGAAASNAVPYLIQTLDDPDFSIRDGALGTLAGMGPVAGAAKGPLLAVVKDGAAQGLTNASTHRIDPASAAYALHLIAPGDAEVVSALVDCVNHRNPTNRWALSQASRVAAAVASMAPEDPKVVSALLDLIASPGPSAELAALAQRWLRATPDPLPTFQRVRKLLAPKETWGLVSAVADRSHGSTNVTAALQELLDDSDYGIRCQAVGEVRRWTESDRWTELSRGKGGPLSADFMPKLTELFRATEKEWEDGPGDARQARFEAYDAYVQATRPATRQPNRNSPGPDVFQALYLRYGAGPGPQRFFAALVADAGRAASSPTATHSGPRMPGSDLPANYLLGLGGLHHAIITAFQALGRRATNAVPLLAGEYQDPTDPLWFEAVSARLEIDGDFPAVMPALRARLEHGDAWSRKVIVAVLVSWADHAPDAVKLLMQAAAGNSDRSLRLLAWRSLPYLGALAVRALPVFIEALDDPDPEIRRLAIQQLGPEQFREASLSKVGSETLLLGAMKDPDPQVRLRAFEGMAAWDGGDIRALPVLIQALDDTEPAVRAQAVLGLVGQGKRGFTVTPHLIKALGDPDWHVRLTASEGLGRLGAKGEPALPALRRLAQDPMAAVRISSTNTIHSIETVRLAKRGR